MSPECAAYFADVPGRTEANAKLIAAAPEMLSALKAALAFLEAAVDCGSGAEAVDALASVRAAIARAEGRL